MSWGISDTASEKEKIKAEFNDFIQGLNSTCEIDYKTYSQLYDFTMPLFDRMYEIGKNDSKHKDQVASPPIMFPTPTHSLVIFSVYQKQGKYRALSLYRPVFHPLCSIRWAKSTLSLIQTASAKENQLWLNFYRAIPTS